MQTNQIELKVTLPINLSEEDAKLFLAMKLYEVGRVSLGQAAALANFSKRAFIDLLSHHHIPVVNYSVDELRQEVVL